MSFLSNLRRRAGWLAAELRNHLGWASTGGTVDRSEETGDNPEPPSGERTIVPDSHALRPTPEPAEVIQHRYEGSAEADLAAVTQNERPIGAWRQGRENDAPLGAYRGEFANALTQIADGGEALLRDVSINRICGIAGRVDEDFRRAIASLTADQLIHCITEVHRFSANSPIQGAYDPTPEVLMKRCLANHGLDIPPEPASAAQQIG